MDTTHRRGVDARLLENALEEGRRADYEAVIAFALRDQEMPAGDLV